MGQSIHMTVVDLLICRILALLPSQSKDPKHSRNSKAQEPLQGALLIKLARSQVHASHVHAIPECKREAWSPSEAQSCLCIMIEHYKTMKCSSSVTQEHWVEGERRL